MTIKAQKQRSHSQFRWPEEPACQAVTKKKKIQATFFRYVSGTTSRRDVPSYRKTRAPPSTELEEKKKETQAAELALKCNWVKMKKDTIFSYRPWTNNACLLINTSRMHCTPPNTAAPSEDRPEGRRTGGAGSPQSQLAEQEEREGGEGGNVSLQTPTTPSRWICSSSTYLQCYPFILAACSVIKHPFKNTNIHKNTPLTHPRLAKPRLRSVKL